MSLKALLAPQSVAVIGASENPDKIGGRPLRYLREFGFSGRVFPINPTRQSVQGIAAFPSLDALPTPPEAVIIAVAGQAAIEAVEASARIGAKVAIVMASGFGETGDLGKREEARMREVAHAGGMRVVGPNSQGSRTSAPARSFRSQLCSSRPHRRTVQSPASVRAAQ